MTAINPILPVVGVGHQVAADLKKLEAVKSTLEDAAMQLGLKSEHATLSRMINQAIEEAASLASSADEYLNSFI
jgi:hypothetical protein